MKKWYPKKLMVGQEGTKSTYDFIEDNFAPSQHFHYAEFGFHDAATAKNICKLFPNATLHLFDFQSKCDEAKEKLKDYQNELHFYGNTEKYNDSYNWSLIKLFYANEFEPLFDYCFLDGAHTFAVDALNFFLCDRMTKVGGFIDFDDYNWRMRGSSLDPNKVPEVTEQYTDEQINTKQVKLIVDGLVKTDPRYKEIVPNKIYQKTSNDKPKNQLHEVVIDTLDESATEKQTPNEFTLFDGADALFKRLLANVKTYFEYGCGKSTEYVYQFTEANIFAVDTSQVWASRVKKIAANDLKKRLNVKWVDVGPVGPWGYPTSLEKQEHFPEYTDFQWASEVTPDLVLIDGRFRVCCFLTTVKNAPIGTKILFDDYNNRPHYHVAESVLKVIEKCGRQALFIVDEQGKNVVTDALIEEFRNVTQ